MARLQAALAQHCGNCDLRMWNQEPVRAPRHQDVPYAFKAFAMRDAAMLGADLLLWCDASALPIRSLEPLWERIERDGYWMTLNGWTNYEWTADSAYPDLFSWAVGGEPCPSLDDMRALNRTIPHVMAGCFGLNVRHPKGKAFLDEFYRLASETEAFCGPWTNANYSPSAGPPVASQPPRIAPCGPSDVRGHRHDQTAASVLAWRLGFELTSPPDIFAYKGGETEKTLIVLDGSYK
jgi:hypothetical protein